MISDMLSYTQNRELSWLCFNHRVLEEAQDESVPLLERMKFVAIFTSNLDEFFMIRVGSLYDMVSVGGKRRDRRSGMSPEEQLHAIYEKVAPLYKERDKTYTSIKELLEPYGVCGLSMKELAQSEKKYLRKYFKSQILPVLSPQLVDVNHPFPHLLNKEIYVTATLRQGNKEWMGIVPVPDYISDVVYMPGHDIRYVRMEKIIMEYMQLIFKDYEILEKNYICVTRNADISPDDEIFADDVDFRKRMKATLNKRRRMAVVRLEVAEPLSREREEYFCDKFHIHPSQIFRTKMPMKLGYMFDVIEKVPENMKKSLVYPAFIPQPSRMLTEGSVMRQVKRRDILLSYPYESMEGFLTLLKEAAFDPNVLTIKITIYRMAKKTRLVEYLCQAAENGKEVTALIELRARFDEQNNIDWSERLEEAGCRVIYGLEGYKVHSKICLITYRNRGEIQYITQIGTGNYNEKTATMYTDLCLMTARQEVGQDAVAFFQDLAIGNLEGHYKNLIVSPHTLKKTVLEKMAAEQKKGSKGRIIMKMNSLTDVDFIEKLEECSCAGVKIYLIVRGICCILPGVPGHTENIRVMSIVGRYLEHARIFSFGMGPAQEIFIGSADMMTRNTEKRVEVACKVEDSTIQNWINHMLKVMLSDNVKGRNLTPQGTYVKRRVKAPQVNSQEEFMKEARLVGERKKQSRLQKDLVKKKVKWVLHR